MSSPLYKALKTFVASADTDIFHITDSEGNIIAFMDPQGNLSAPQVNAGSAVNGILGAFQVPCCVAEAAGETGAYFFPVTQGFTGLGGSFTWPYPFVAPISSGILFLESLSGSLTVALNKPALNGASPFLNPDAGKILIIQERSSVTTTTVTCSSNGFNSAGSSYSTAAFGAEGIMVLMAFGTTWVVIYSSGVTFS